MLKKLGVLTSVLALASFFYPAQASAEDFHHRDRNSREHFDHGNHDRHEFVEHRRFEQRQRRGTDHRVPNYRNYSSGYYSPGYVHGYYGPTYVAPAPCPPRGGVYFSWGR